MWRRLVLLVAVTVVSGGGARGQSAPPALPAPAPAGSVAAPPQLVATKLLAPANCEWRRRKDEIRAKPLLVCRDEAGEWIVPRLYRGFDENTAAKANAGDAEAIAHLAIFYSLAPRPTRDRVRALELARAAAAKGNALGMNLLGSFFRDGVGINQDHVAAAQWFQKAVELGDANAMDNLAICYATGDGVQKDEAKAVSLLRKASSMGEAVASKELAFAYVNGGLGLHTDRAESLRWMSLAARQGSPVAMDIMANLYVEGDGVPRDPTEAARLRAAAANASDEGSPDALVRQAMAPAP